MCIFVCDACCKIVSVQSRVEVPRRKNACERKQERLNQSEWAEGEEEHQPPPTIELEDRNITTRQSSTHTIESCISHLSISLVELIGLI